jgi:hypothetical protein
MPCVVIKLLNVLERPHNSAINPLMTRIARGSLNGSKYGKNKSNK